MSFAAVVHNFRSWNLKNENKNAFIIVTACIIGCLAGVAAFLMKWVIRHIAHALRLVLGSSLHSHGLDWWLLSLPLVGILLAVAWQKWVARANMVHCTTKIVEYLTAKNYNIPAKFTFNPIVACGITLGFGGSAGAEGPVALVGASAASKFGRWLGVDDEMLRVMVGIGAGAAIAGIFKSPIAGVLFTIEVLRMNLAAAPVTGLIMSCVCASVTCYAFTGSQVNIPYNQSPSLDIPVYWVGALGVFCGIYSLFYNWVTRRMRHFFETRRHQWVSWVTGGIIIGAILFLFPAMYGEGDPLMTELINGSQSGLFAGGLFASVTAHNKHFLLVLALMLLLKSLITVCSNSAGGVAGDFAPTLFAGVLAGTLFSMTMESLFGVHIPVTLCALFAMAGTFAGIVHAPVMSIFLIMEMTGTFNFILPITVCAAASYLTVKIMYPASRSFVTHYDDLVCLFSRHSSDSSSDSTTSTTPQNPPTSN